MDKRNIKTKTNYRQALEKENTLIQKNKQTNTQTKVRRSNKNYITQNIRIIKKYY
jgi:hypothetical protein